MLKLPPSLPTLEAILSDNPGWLEEAIDTKAASKLTGVSVQTLETWRSRGGGPHFVKLGAKTVRYPRRELITWMRAKVCASTADADKSRA
jgi:predicted DNA-binding transcriptional regulator AlpA